MKIFYYRSGTVSFVEPFLYSNFKKLSQQNISRTPGSEQNGMEQTSIEFLLSNKLYDNNVKFERNQIIKSRFKFVFRFKERILEGNIKK